jgi:hypothetical protein
LMINRVLAHSGAPSTVLKCKRGISLYKAFAASTGVARCDWLHTWLPASENLLMAFAASFSGKRAATTVHSYIAAVR